MIYVYIYAGLQNNEGEISGSCDTHEEEANCIYNLVRNTERKWVLERPKHRWEGGIKMGLMEVGWGGVNWIYMAHDRGELVAASSTPVP
jgi:hypothetical protein